MPLEFFRGISAIRVMDVLNCHEVGFVEKISKAEGQI